MVLPSIVTAYDYNPQPQPQPVENPPPPPPSQIIQQLPPQPTGPQVIEIKDKSSSIVYSNIYYNDNSYWII